MNNMDNLQFLLSKAMLNLLKKDHNFFTYKSVNALINTIIINTHQNLIEKIENFSDILKTEIKINYCEINPNLLMSKLIKQMIEFDDTKDIKDERFKLTISKEARNTFRNIEQKLFKEWHVDVQLSTFIRIILYTYSKLSRIEREKIIFSQNFEKINSSIKNKSVLKIYLKKGKDILTVLPYGFVYPLEDDLSFLFAENEKNETIKIRISEIEDIIQTNDKKKASAECLAYYSKIKNISLDSTKLASLFSKNKGFQDIEQMEKSLSRL